MPHENYRGILFMVAAMTGFIANDTFVKLASESIPIPQIIVLRSLIALPLVLLFCWYQGLLGNLLALGDKFLWLRTLGELCGTAAFLTALARLDLANITAIAQLTPLAVTAAAAIFMREKVGIRRWSAIVIGFPPCCWSSAPERRALTAGPCWRSAASASSFCATSAPVQWRTASSPSP
jgi:drug/metabolite transporter (DMT)-like permease